MRAIDVVSVCGFLVVFFVKAPGASGFFKVRGDWEVVLHDHNDVVVFVCV